MPTLQPFTRSPITSVQDKKKVMAEEPVFGLASVDLVELDAPTLHVAQHLPSIK